MDIDIQLDCNVLALDVLKRIKTKPIDKMEIELIEYRLKLCHTQLQHYKQKIEEFKYHLKMFEY